MEKCKAIIRFADDQGDNEATFHCELPEGHPGRHRESGVMYQMLPYAVEWEGSMVNDEEEEVVQ